MPLISKLLTILPLCFLHLESSRSLCRQPSSWLRGFLQFVVTQTDFIYLFVKQERFVQLKSAREDRVRASTVAVETQCRLPSPVGILHGSPGLCVPHSLATGHPEAVSPGLQETLGQCPARGMRLSQNCSQGQGYGHSMYNCSYSLNIIVVTWHKIQEIKKNTHVYNRKLSLPPCPQEPHNSSQSPLFVVYAVGTL